MVDTAFFEDYTGTTAPTNFNRLNTIASAEFKRFYRDDLTDECKEILKQSICEQILWLIDTDNKVELTGVALGRASENYAIKETHKGLISPTAKMLLGTSPCNFLYAGIGVKQCGCD